MIKQYFHPARRTVRGIALAFLYLWLAPAGVAAGVPGSVELSGFVLNQESGEGTLRINAREALYEDESTAVLVQVVAQLTEKDKVRLSLSAESGRYLGAERLLQLEGSVSAVTAEGYRFGTSTLEWDAARGLVRSRGAVQVTRAGLLVTGSRMEYVVQSGRTVIVGDVRATLSLIGASP